VPSAVATASAGQNDSSPAWLWVVAAVALVAGLYGRFKGLGTAPLGVDEFYVSRSVDNILRTGLPEFLCGGYYNRGPVYQYLIGAVRLLGLSPELAGRLLSALFNLAVLPAAYVLGRRVHGKSVGLLAVIVLCLSVWEIEMARFARMYAPFQAVFAWYLVCFLNYLRDENRSALFGMMALSLLGVLIWEGGALLGILNLLPPLLRHREGRLRNADYGYLGGMLLLFAVLYQLAIVDLRTYSQIPPYAAWYTQPLTDPGSDALRALGIGLPPGRFWMALAVLPLIACAASLRWIWSLRARWLTASGLLVAMAAALAHQFCMVLAVLTLLLLMRLIEWRELSGRAARVYVASLILCGIYWLCAGLGSDLWVDTERTSLVQAAQIVGMKLFGYPNMIDAIARPWGRTLPFWSLCMFGALAGLAVTTVRNTAHARSPLDALLIVAVILLLAIGASGTERLETRYSFFLYPLLLILALAALGLATSWFASRPRPIAAGSMMSMAALACFAAGEDFQPRHLIAIDSDAINFRVGMSPALIGHYYPHNDVRGAAAWLRQNVPAQDSVLSGIPSLDQYYDRAAFTFLLDDDPRYEAFSCHAGTLDRWTNRPLLYSAAALDELVQRQRIFLVSYPSQTQLLLEKARRYDWQVAKTWASIDGGVEILSLRSGGPALHTSPLTGPPGQQR
jgi:hypothetical protein